MYTDSRMTIKCALDLSLQKKSILYIGKKQIQIHICLADRLTPFTKHFMCR